MVSLMSSSALSRTTPAGSGIQRARVNLVDGQVYTVGLNGWDDPPGNEEGTFQRLRYTGRDFRMIDAMAVTPQGLKLTFNFELGDAATSPEHYEIEQWDYKWDASYGSGHYHRTPANPATNRSPSTRRASAPTAGPSTCTCPALRKVD